VVDVGGKLGRGRVFYQQAWPESVDLEVYLIANEAGFL
jgi:hypothetical protein